MKERDYSRTVYRRGHGDNRGNNPTLDGEEIWATEVISVGVEFMRRDPLKFALEYPKYFDFLMRRVIYRGAD